ncbi:hypothetical protein [Ekhidna sp.]|uniref:hypothetical protein n=1 Tax=Ekhidna sp. TaxID=2608089 RepID=UPI003299BC90
MLTILIAFLFQPQLSGWELLSSVEIVMGFDDFMGVEVEQPKFSDQLKLREGKELTLEGFIIPLQQESEQDYFILSRFPYQSCFFCGAAGPETVVEVYSDHNFRYTDERVRVKGILRLNNDNPLHLFYILEDCEVTKLE